MNIVLFTNKSEPFLPYSFPSHIKQRECIIIILISNHTQTILKKLTILSFLRLYLLFFSFIPLTKRTVLRVCIPIHAHKSAHNIVVASVCSCYLGTYHRLLPYLAASVIGIKFKSFQLIKTKPFQAKEKKEIVGNKLI